MAVRLHIQAIVRWHDHCDAILRHIRDGGGLKGVCDIIVEWTTTPGRSTTRL